MWIPSMCELVEPAGSTQSWSPVSPLLKSEPQLSWLHLLEWEVLLLLSSVLGTLWLDGGDRLLEGHPQGQIPYPDSP
jgi:hypothetical protein